MTKQIEIITISLPATDVVPAVDNEGNKLSVDIVREHPLTIYLNNMEIVTLMTMGTMPAYLVAGFLLNQQLINSTNDIASIHIDWEVSSAAVYAKQNDSLEAKARKRVVTSGCGQGTMFSNVMADIKENKTTSQKINQQQIYSLLSDLSKENEVYRKSGGVHSCALCTHKKVIKTIEDVGRHNAIDALAGFMAIESVLEVPTVMYTTGRLTSEMVIKTAQMGVSILLSRSGATSMGVEVANSAGITLISRAKGKKYIVLSGYENVIL